MAPSLNILTVISSKTVNDVNVVPKTLPIFLSNKSGAYGAPPITHMIIFG